MILYRLVTLLSLLLGTVAVAEAQVEPNGYWLYVDKVWRGSFASREACEAAGAKTTGTLSQCAGVYNRPAEYYDRLAVEQRQWKQRQAVEQLYNLCDSVRSDRATPALLEQCRQLLGR